MANRHMIAWLVMGTLAAPVGAAPDLPMSASERAALLQTLSAKLRENYIAPEVAERTSAALAAKNASGGYASVATVQRFSAALSHDLHAFSGDRHFQAVHDERFRERGGDAPAGSAELAQQRQDHARGGFGIGRVERLAGNVGYLEVRGFGHSAMVAPAYGAAMALLDGTDALILDLRRNGGGPPDSVAYLMSHFFAIGDERHLHDVVDRPSGKTRQYWTLPTVAQRYDKPVYVLTSARTFSAGEECAYDFQAQQRGIVVGESTGGGANPVTRFSVGSGIAVRIPTARTVNAVTGTSWEGSGVKPDIAVPAAQAQQVAHVAILKQLRDAARDPAQRADLARALAMVEKGELAAPSYTLKQ